MGIGFGGSKTTDFRIWYDADPKEIERKSYCLPRDSAYEYGILA